MALIPIVVAMAAGLVSVGLLPVLGGAAGALNRINDAFLPNEENLLLPAFPERSTIYASDGSVLATLFLDENRTIVRLDQIRKVTADAVLAIEDAGFYDHGPVDLTSIIRAALANLRAGEIVQGGSTISQQLVKNTETTGERTFSRKFQEAQDAIRLERTYTKDQILELYLNQVLFGHGVYGIGTAAEYYFAKPVGKLTLAESALLAGMIAAPARFDPINRRTAALLRRNQVLRRMRDLEWITEQQFQHALSVPIRLKTTMRNANEPGPEPYFVDFVKEEILGDPRFGKTRADRVRALFQGGLKIYTTLAPRMQQFARESIENRLPNQGPRPPADPQAAIVTIVPQSGAIRAMVGGTNYSEQKFNLATQSQRSAGSAFKAFTLAAALEQGIPPGKVYKSSSPLLVPGCDEPPGWEVSNAEPGGGGYISLWDATRLSVNVVFAQLIRDVGPENVVDVAARMGMVRDHMSAVCSLTLGIGGFSPLEMTSGYSTLANEGIHCTPFAITRVATRTGRTIFRTRPECKRALSPDLVALETAMLERVVSGGTGTAANIGRPQAGKTGTGQEYQDAWFMGYIPQLTTGVWVGYSKAEIPMRALPVLGYGNAFGGTIAAPIWHDYMIRAVQGMPVKDFPPPPPQKSGTVPDVVGERRQEAEDILTEASYTAIVQTVESAQPAGIVVSQTPCGGCSAPLGSVVVIDVSTGTAPEPSPPPPPAPEKVTVPSVVGLTQSHAAAVLQRDGFEVAVTYEAVDDRKLDERVLSQSPGGGTRAAAGSTVTITVGKFKPGGGGGPGGG